MSTKKAVSDMVGAVILIAIVIIGFAGIVYPLILRFQSASQGALKYSQEQSLQAEVLVTPVYSYSSQSKGHTYFYVYLYNYGKVAFTPSYFIVSMLNAGTYEVTSFSMVNAQTGSAASSIQPGTVAEVEFAINYSGPVPSAYNLTAVGNGMSLSWSL